MRIGVFGGSFDPVHTGHLAAARAVADRVGLDQVRFVPAAQQPFKAGHHASGADRAAMLDLAVAGEPRFVVDRRELSRGGPSYTVDTLRSLRADFPGDQLFLMMGADTAREVTAWRDAAELPSLATVVVHSRPGVPVPPLPWVVEQVEIEAPAVSATEARQAAASGTGLDHMVPASVAVFIRARGLYRTEDAC